MGDLIKGGIRREDIERLVRVEQGQAGVAADVGEIKDAVLKMGAVLAEQSGDLLEIKTDIKLINARHRALKRKVAIISGTVAVIATGAGHYAADIWHIFFPPGGAK